MQTLIVTIEDIARLSEIKTASERLFLSTIPATEKTISERTSGYISKKELCGHSDRWEDSLGRKRFGKQCLRIFVLYKLFRLEAK